jgi:hypothetical protein
MSDSKRNGCDKVKMDEFSKNINFAKVLFLHINRILMSQDNNQFIASISLLESALCPYIDYDYTIEVSGCSDGVDSVKNLDPTVRKKYMLQQEEMNSANIKFRALMKLAERNHLLLEKEGEGIDPGYDDSDPAEGYDNPETAV